MLRALKWAYDLGVKQERVRIASHLKMQVDNAVITSNSFNTQLGDPAVAKNRKEDIKRRQAVERQVLDIISSILQPNWEQSMTASIMFPDGEEKR